MIIKEIIYIDTDKITDFVAFKEEQEKYIPHESPIGKGKISSPMLVFTKDAEYIKTYESVFEAARDYNISSWAMYQRVSKHKIKVVDGEVFILEKDLNKDLVEFLTSKK